MSAAVPGTELFPFLFATWVFELHVAGQVASDERIREACDAVRAATEPEAGNRAGNALVDRVRELVSDQDPGAVLAAAQRLYGDKVKSDLGQGDRTERAARIRKYQFSHPLPWLAPMLNGVEHANFFETRATEYSKAATKGNWNDVWENFDRRQKAKAAAANDGLSAEASAEEDGGPDDMFSRAGVAAE